MCSTYDYFDWYVEWVREPTSFSPELGVWGAACSCGHRPQLGEPVRAFGGRESLEDPCPWCTDLEWWHGDGEVPIVDDYGCEVPGMARECHVCQGTGEDLSGVTEHVEFFCVRCDAARVLLDEWCDERYNWGSITDQIVDHWHEDALYQSPPFGALCDHARTAWRRRNGSLVDLTEVERLVAESLAAVQNHP